MKLLTKHTWPWWWLTWVITWLISNWVHENPKTRKPRSWCYTHTRLWNETSTLSPVITSNSVNKNIFFFKKKTDLSTDFQLKIKSSCALFCWSNYRTSNTGTDNLIVFVRLNAWMRMLGTNFRIARKKNQAVIQSLCKTLRRKLKMRLIRWQGSYMVSLIWGRNWNVSEFVLSSIIQTLPGKWVPRQAVDSGLTELFKNSVASSNHERMSHWYNAHVDSFARNVMAFFDSQSKSANVSYKLLNWCLGHFFDLPNYPMKKRWLWTKARWAGADEKNGKATLDSLWSRKRRI